MKVLSSLFCWLPKVADFSTWFLHLLPFSKKKESSLFLCTDSWCCYNKNRVKSKPSKEVTDLYQQQQEKIGIKTIYKCHGRGSRDTVEYQSDVNDEQANFQMLILAVTDKNTLALHCSFFYFSKILIFSITYSLEEYLWFV